jgi:MFS transporter, DHA2 family, multidrug resistance protein
MCVGFFIALLDIQIVSASLRDIGDGRSAGADDTRPLRVMSTRWPFCVSAAGFTLTGLLCGWAWDIESVIAFLAL